MKKTIYLFLSLWIVQAITATAVAQCTSYPSVTVPAGFSFDLRTMFVDKTDDIVASPSSIDTLLDFCDSTDINHIILYNVHTIISSSDTNDDDDLYALISQAHQAGLTVSSVVSSTAKAHDVVNWHDTMGLAADSGFDGLLYEFEYWVSTTNYEGWGSKAQAFSKEFEPSLIEIDSICHARSMTCESYIGNDNDTSHLAGIYLNSDRIYVHYYRDSPYDHSSCNIFNFKSTRLNGLGDVGQSRNQNVPILLLYNSRSSYMKGWLENHTGSLSWKEMAAEPAMAWMHFTDGYEDNKGQSGYDYLDHLDVKGFCWYRYSNLREASSSHLKRSIQWNSETSVTSFKLYPNPASDWVNVQLPDEQSVRQVVLVDVAGRSTVLPFQANRVDLEGISAGTYALIVTTDHEPLVARIIIR